MIQTNNNTVILPLDVTSIMTLLSPSSKDFMPLHHTIDQTTVDGVSIRIDISLCDADSIQITVKHNQLIVSAQALLQLTDKRNKPLTLCRRYEQSIDLPHGILTPHIRSQINENDVTIYLPFSSEG